MPLCIRNEIPEGAGINVAIGNQSLIAENESYRSAFGTCCIQFCSHRGRHEQPAIFFIEPVGGFDLAHFLAGWNLDAQLLFDGALFLKTWLKEVYPYGMVWYALNPLGVSTCQAARVSDVGVQHGRSGTMLAGGELVDEGDQLFMTARLTNVGNIFTVDDYQRH